MTALLHSSCIVSHPLEKQSANTEFKVNLKCKWLSIFIPIFTILVIYHCNVITKNN